MSYLNQLFDLSDIRAVVTGGAGALPSVMAEALAKAGAQVALWGRGTSHRVDEAADRIAERAGAHGRVYGFTVDTATEDAVSDALARTENSLGLPNLLVNGVGGNRGKTAFTELDVETFRSVFELNVLAGLVIPTKVFARRWMSEEQPAAIINLASMSSYVPLSGVWAYDAAKSAVMNLTVATAKEFAPAGIRVNAIAPGFFVGHQNKHLLIADESTGELTERGREIIGRTPLGRFGSFEDIEGVTVFLASPQASQFVTGVAVPVDGGFLTDNV